MNNILVCDQCGAKLKVKPATLRAVNEVKCSKCMHPIKLPAEMKESVESPAPAPKTADRPAAQPEASSPPPPQPKPDAVRPTAPDNDRLAALETAVAQLHAEVSLLKQAQLAAARRQVDVLGG